MTLSTPALMHLLRRQKKWFEKQPETYDANGVRCYGMEDFEDFKNYMKGE